MKKKLLTKQILLALAAAAMLPAGQAGAETLTNTTTINVSSGEHPYELDSDVTYKGGDTWLTNTGGTVTVNDKEPANSLTVHGAGNGIYNANNGQTSITANGGITLQAMGTGSGITSGILNQNYNLEEEMFSETTNQITIQSDGAVSIGGSQENGQRVNGIASLVMAYTTGGVKNITEITGSSVTVSSKGDSSNRYSGALYLSSMGAGTLTNKVTITGTGIEDNHISSDTRGVVITANRGETAVEVISEQADNILQSGDYAMDLSGGTVIFKAENGDNWIEANTAYSRNESGAIHTNDSYVELTARNNTIISHNMGGIWGGSIPLAINPDQINRKTILTATDGNNTITATNEEGVTDIITLYASDNYAIELSAEQGNNVITQIDEPRNDDGSGVVMAKSGKITLKAHGNTEGTGTNIIRSDKEGTEHYKVDALYAEGAKDASGSIALNAETGNFLYGSMTAQADGSITLTGTNNYIQTATISDVYLGGTGPTVPDSGYHYAVRAIGGIDSAQEDSQIQITANGGVNQIISEGNVWAEEVNSERAVFATEGGSVSIDGTSVITAGAWEDNNAEGYQANNTSASLIAGTFDENKAVTNDEGIIFDLEAMGEENVSSIALNYGAGSAVTGDIVAGYGGKISVTEQAGKSGISTMADGPAMTLRGNALAANGGSVTLELGANSYWAGRADDYQDAASADWRDTHANVYKPIFSQIENENPIQMNGTVNVTLGQNATWDVMGQSWVTNLGGNGGIIDMRNTAGDESSTSHAVHVGTLTGNHTFVMDLNRNQHNISDMLYIYDTANSSGQQTVFLNSISGIENMEDGEKLRFATVHTDKLSFEGEYRGENGYDNAGDKVMVRDMGVNDMALVIGSEKYVETNQEENEGYNGADFSEAKPGDDYVDSIYGDGGINWYLTRDSGGDELSDAGKTVIAMSKVNYSNAVYMDRLNKRMGEARYIDGDDGLWVRMRHDRIGKDDAFRSMNTMFELGYDWHTKGQKDGEHRQGVAFDYMRGTADYQNVIGDGDVRRAGVWLYDTWLGDKGHYSDYVVKYGRLSNDFDIYGRSNGEKISGDYDNDVWSVSAEYGRKKDIGNEWYFEPQVQAQYAYVTSADYTTSQNTKVHLDGIDSLIGRAGFRLGRDTSEGNTVYFKADILHEFLGDQSIRATDITGTLDTTYENEGTWYDVGFGFAHKMGEDSYLFLDVEHSFGNDNDDTYQVNIGLNRAF